jgi:hypothetical protein
VANEVLWVTFDDVAKHVSSLVFDITALGDGEAGKVLELGQLVLDLIDGGEILRRIRKDLNSADQIPIFVQNLTVVADDLSNEIVRISFGNSTEWLAGLVQNLAAVADFETLQCREIQGQLVGYGPRSVLGGLLDSMDGAADALGGTLGLIGWSATGRRATETPSEAGDMVPSTVEEPAGGRAGSL